MNLDNMNTTYRISSRSTIQAGVKTFVGRVRYYSDGKFIFTESAGVHRLTACDAQVDAYRLMYDRLWARY